MHGCCAGRGRVGSTGTMIDCGDAADWGKGGAESKRVWALCFWGVGKVRTRAKLVA